ncbi:hypothetical protein D3C81_2293030 [compost metagenome]
MEATLDRALLLVAAAITVVLVELTVKLLDELKVISPCTTVESVPVPSINVAAVPTLAVLSVLRP